MIIFCELPLSTDRVNNVHPGSGPRLCRPAIGTRCDGSSVPMRGSCVGTRRRHCYSPTSSQSVVQSVDKSLWHASPTVPYHLQPSSLVSTPSPPRWTHAQLTLQPPVIRLPPL